MPDFRGLLDRIAVIGLPRAAPAQILRPSSLRTLRVRVEDYGVVTDENVTDVLDIGRRLLDAASSVTDSLHGSDGEAHVRELPHFVAIRPLRRYQRVDDAGRDQAAP